MASPDCIKYGGNTACLAVEGSEDGSLVVMDGGTGLPWLGRSLLGSDMGRGQGQAHVLVSQLYWDHIQGIPFFIPLLIPGNSVTLYGAGSAGLSFEGAMRAQMDSVYCPVPDFFGDSFGATVEIRDIGEGDFEIGSIRVQVLVFTGADGHCGLGYRLEEGNSALVYLPSIEYSTAGDRRRAVELARGADLLIHDAHYTDDEYLSVEGPGHATDREAVETARQAEVGRLWLFHYHPDRDDEAIDAVVAQYGDLDFAVEGAREGAEITLES